MATAIRFYSESQYPQLQLRLISGSVNFLYWMKYKISDLLKIKRGWLEVRKGVWILVYAKADSIKILKFIYYPKVEFYLKRKYNIAKPFLRV